MKKIPNLSVTGYCIFNKDTGKQFRDVAETTSMAKRRYTECANWGNSATQYGLRPGVKFDKQTDFSLHQLVNPVGLMKFLEDSKGCFANADDLIELLQENLNDLIIK